MYTKTLELNEQTSIEVAEIKEYTEEIEAQNHYDYVKACAIDFLFKQFKVDVVSLQESGFTCIVITNDGQGGNVFIILTPPLHLASDPRLGPKTWCFPKKNIIPRN